MPQLQPARGFQGTGYEGTNIVGRRDGNEAVKKKLEAPKFNASSVAGLAQEQQAPALAALRRNLQAVQAGRFGSLLGRREAIRGATRGFGEALPTIQAGAQQAAFTQAQREFQLKTIEFQEELRRKQEEDAIRKEEEERSTRRGSSAGGETYAQAQARLNAPSAASTRFDARTYAPQQNVSLGNLNPNWMRG